MTKLLQSDKNTIDFGVIKFGESKSEDVTVSNIGDEKATVTGISISDNFTSDISGTIYPDFPTSETIYFDENGNVSDANGTFHTSDLGYGTAGTTDGTGIFTVGIVPPETFYYLDDDSNIFIDDDGNKFTHEY